VEADLTAPPDMRGHTYMSALCFAEKTAQTVEQRPELPVSWIRQLFPGAYSLRAMTLLLGLTTIRSRARPVSVALLNLRASQRSSVWNLPEVVADRVMVRPFGRG
jgi:hypothetical protein